MSDPSTTLPRRRRRRPIRIPGTTLTPAALILCIAIMGGTLSALIFKIVEALG